MPTFSSVSTRGLIPREMNLPCSNPITAARLIFQQEKLDILNRKHSEEKAIILSEKETEQQYAALLEEKLGAAGIALPDKPEPPQNQVSVTEAEDLVSKRVDGPLVRISLPYQCPLSQSATRGLRRR